MKNLNVNKKRVLVVAMAVVFLLINILGFMFLTSQKNETAETVSLPPAQSSTGGAELGEPCGDDLKVGCYGGVAPTDTPVPTPTGKPDRAPDGYSAPAEDPSIPSVEDMRNNWSDFPKGTCLNGMGQNVVSMKLLEVPCESPHDGVVLGVKKYPSGPEQTYPEATFLSAELETEFCDISNLPQGWTTSMFIPSQHQWDTDQRGVVCFGHHAGEATPVIKTQSWELDLNELTENPETAPTLPLTEAPAPAPGRPVVTQPAAVPAPAPSAKTVTPPVSSNAAKPAVTAPAVPAPAVTAPAVPEASITTYYGICPEGFLTSEAFSAECGVGVTKGSLDIAPPAGTVLIAYACNGDANPMKNINDVRCSVSITKGMKDGE